MSINFYKLYHLSKDVKHEKLNNYATDKQEVAELLGGENINKLSDKMKNKLNKLNRNAPASAD